jgi:hypothetical protein
LAFTIVRPALRSGWGIGVLSAFAHAAVDYPFARFAITAWMFALVGALFAVEMRKVERPFHYLDGR